MKVGDGRRIPCDPRITKVTMQKDKSRAAEDAER